MPAALVTLQRNWKPLRAAVPWMRRVAVLLPVPVLLGHESVALLGYCPC